MCMHLNIYGIRAIGLEFKSGGMSDKLVVRLSILNIKLGLWAQLNGACSLIPKSGHPIVWDIFWSKKTEKRMNVT